MDCRNVAGAWDVGKDANGVVKMYGGYVVPRSFRFQNEKVEAYEYEFSEELISDKIDLGFLSEFSELLRQRGLDQILGLRFLGETDSKLTIEVTQNNLNITMPFWDDPGSKMVEALWVFGEEEDHEAKCRQVCTRDATGHYHIKHIKV